MSMQLGKYIKCHLLSKNTFAHLKKMGGLQTNVLSGVASRYIYQKVKGILIYRPLMTSGYSAKKGIY